MISPPLQGDKLDLDIPGWPAPGDPWRFFRGRFSFGGSRRRRGLFRLIPFAKEVLDVQSPIGMNGQAGIEIGQSDPINVDKERVVSNIHPGDGQAFPFQKILGVPLVKGGKMANRPVPFVGRLQAGPFGDLDPQVSVRRDAAIGHGDLGLVGEIGLEGTDGNLIQGDLQVGGDRVDPDGSIQGYFPLFVETQSHGRFGFPVSSRREVLGFHLQILDQHPHRSVGLPVFHLHLIAAQ